MSSSFMNRANDKFGAAVASLMMLTILMTTAINVAGQKTRSVRDKTVVKNDENAPLEGVDLKLVSSVPLGLSNYYRMLAPSVVAANSVYSNFTTFTGSGVSNGGAAVDPANAANTITNLLADDLTLSGTATVAVPINVLGYRFSVANLNTTAVSARPRIRFYLANGANGGPGTYITGNSFNAISFPAGSVNVFDASTAFGAAGVSFSSVNIWAAMTFDNNGGATGATVAQLNNLGQGTYNPPDRGTSADTGFGSSTNGSFLSNNPPGSQFNFGGAPVVNLGWEITARTTALSINRLDTDPRTASSTASWTVNFNTPVSGLTAANFTLPTTDAASGTITSVTPNGTLPTQNFTVTATLGAGSGTIGLNLANATGLNTTVTNALPFVGQVYTVNVVTAAAANVEGRVLTADGAGISNAKVQLTDVDGINRLAITNPFGYFSFQEVSPGAVYILNVSHKSYTFADASQVIYVTGDYQGLNFFAQPR